MSYDINELMGLAYKYCNEEKSLYVAGQTLYHSELNKPRFEALAGFINWVALDGFPATPELKKPTPEHKVGSKR